MKVTTLLHVLICLLAVACIYACGGGGGSETTATSGTTSITSIGTITGFGSVYVGDTKFETEDADIYRDDDLLSQDNLRIGMVVTVEGKYADDDEIGYAYKISYDNELKGPISRIALDSTDPSIKELEVMGKKVIVKKGETKFEDTSFEELVEGMFIEVSGYKDSSDAIQATYIEKISNQYHSIDDEIEIEGFVTEIGYGIRNFCDR